jgi:4a-hydroxytetrahydrobiopterin dehydratase
VSVPNRSAPVEVQALFGRISLPLPSHFRKESLFSDVAFVAAFDSALADSKNSVGNHELAVDGSRITGGITMIAHLSETELAHEKCSACEGGIEGINPEQAKPLLAELSGWRLTDDGRRIHKDWRMEDFMTAIAFFNRVAEVSESEGHHPDLHLQDYRNVSIELWTHAIGGLSENDFILAAKIDQLK